MLTLTQITERLNDAMQLLIRGSPSLLHHHQTLRMAIDWSYSSEAHTRHKRR